MFPQRSGRKHEFARQCSHSVLCRFTFAVFGQVVCVFRRALFLCVWILCCIRVKKIRFESSPSSWLDGTAPSTHYSDCNNSLLLLKRVFILRFLGKDYAVPEWWRGWHVTGAKAAGLQCAWLGVLWRGLCICSLMLLCRASSEHI